MRVIFSRKGFDSAAGGCPSPLVDGQPFSLPIPTRQPSARRFADLPAPVPDLVQDLTKGKVKPIARCHLDPDLDPSSSPRLKGWRGALGQAGAAEGHLRRQGVQRGDVFLFWGLYRPVAKEDGWRFLGHPEHRLFGWLQIDEVLRVGTNPRPHVQRCPWLADHPHMLEGWSEMNTVYVATNELSIAGRSTGLPGYGVLAHGLRLTSNQSARPSLWQTPDWLSPARGGCGMTYHPRERWNDNGTVQVAARGQEFVAHPANPGVAAEWIINTLRNN